MYSDVNSSLSTLEGICGNYMTHDEENKIIDAFNAAKIPGRTTRIGMTVYFTRPPIPGVDDGKRTPGKVVGYKEDGTIQISDPTGVYDIDGGKRGEWDLSGISGCWNGDDEKAGLKDDWDEYYDIIERRDKASRRI